MGHQIFYKQSWFLRRDGKVSGPFPAGQIKQNILLGRHKNSDEFSHDKTSWVDLESLDELWPKELNADPEDPNALERLEAAKRWADERFRERRTQQRLEEDRKNNRCKDRREDEGKETIIYREKKEKLIKDRYKAKLDYIPVEVVIGLATIILLSYYLFYTPTHQDISAECSGPPHPGINMTNCHMEGADFEGIDLTGANLTNSNLTGANLTRTNLEKADLSYAQINVANLTGAILQRSKLVGASLRGASLDKVNFNHADLTYVDFTRASIAGATFDSANLSHAIWVNGQKCLEGSIGACKTAEN